MAKTRAQRKAERRAREARASRQTTAERRDESRAQQRTQVPESADVIEAEIAEAGVDVDALREADREPSEPAAMRDGADDPIATRPLESPAPSKADVGRPEAPADERIGRRARRQAEKERRARAKEQERRRQRTEVTERQRGAVIGFLISCWAELKRVQWPNRDTLIQASAVTLLFIAVAAAYLGALDAIFSFLVKHLL